MSDQQAIKRKGITFGRVVATVGPVSLLEAPFPTLRTIHWSPQNFNAQGNGQADAPDSYAIVVTQEVLLAVSRHVAQTLNRELGGFLLGNRYRCPNTGRNYVIIDQYLEADYTEGTEVSLNFTKEAWAQLDDQLSGKFMGKLLIGWYHSHPRMNVFLSSHDVEIHEARFKEAWKSALVLEPASHLGGFFSWQDGRLDQHNYVDFYELLEGDSRESVMSWANYNGIDPKTKAAPLLKLVNTRTIVTSPAVTSGENKIAAQNPAAGPAALMSNLPHWLSGTRGWMIAGAVAILVFIAAFAIVMFGLGPSRKTKTDDERTEIPTSQDQPQDSKALDSLQLSVMGKPIVDPQAGTLRVDLKASNIPERIIADVQQGMVVEVDDQNAVLNFNQMDRDGFSYAARVTLKDKIDELKATNKPQNVSVKSSFIYGGSETTIEKLLEIGPLKDKQKTGRVDVREIESKRKKQANTQKPRTATVKDNGTGRSTNQGAQNPDTSVTSEPKIPTGGNAPTVKMDGLGEPPPAHGGTRQSEQQTTDQDNRDRRNNKNKNNKGAQDNKNFVERTLDKMVNKVRGKRG